MAMLILTTKNGPKRPVHKIVFLVSDYSAAFDTITIAGRNKRPFNV